MRDSYETPPTQIISMNCGEGDGYTAVVTLSMSMPYALRAIILGIFTLLR